VNLFHFSAFYFAIWRFLFCNLALFHKKKIIIQFQTKSKPKEKTQKLLQRNSTVSAAVETLRHRENAASLFVSFTEETIRRFSVSEESCISQ
jgi:hypothetical protein